MNLIINNNNNLRVLNLLIYLHTCINILKREKAFIVISISQLKYEILLLCRNYYFPFFLFFSKVFTFQKELIHSNIYEFLCWLFIVLINLLVLFCGFKNLSLRLVYLFRSIQTYSSIQRIIIYFLFCNIFYHSSLT